MAATKDEVEALLIEYRKNKPRSAEPGVFTGGISENAREWLSNFESYAALNDLSEKDKILTFSLLLKAGAKLFLITSQNMNVNHGTKKSVLRRPI